jgi:hypothetical protein
MSLQPAVAPGIQRRKALKVNATLKQTNDPEQPQPQPSDSTQTPNHQEELQEATAHFFSQMVLGIGTSALGESLATCPVVRKCTSTPCH